MMNQVDYESLGIGRMIDDLENDRSKIHRDLYFAKYVDEVRGNREFQRFLSKMIVKAEALEKKLAYYRKSLDN